MKFKNYYDVLGLDREATTAEIKRAYRKLARRYHPDVSDEDNAEERFKEINEAYEALKDPERRRAYDQLGTTWRAGEEFTPPPGWYASRDAHQFEFSGVNFGGFSDFFDSIFGRGEKRSGEPGHDRFRMRGSDQSAAATITLEDSYFGRERIIEVAGGGAPPRRIKLKVPPGITAGQHVRLGGQGMAGYGGESSGDLYLDIHFAPHRIFRADGRDIHLLLPLSPWEAALGAKVTVPTLGNSVALTIKPGSQSGQKLRLAGRGLPGSPAGDQIVELIIRMPVVDTDEKRALFERMRETMAFNPREGWSV
jgi:curved DNA-binding protein